MTTAPPRQKWTALAAACGVGAAALCGPIVASWESGGRQYLKPYRDIAGVWTQCYGETLGVSAVSPIETPDGCDIKLDKRLAGFAQGVVKCSPTLRGRDAQWAAATSLAYNIGVAAYCKSTADRRFDARQWRAGCDAFLAWDKARVKGVLRAVQGLTNRRRAERALCLLGL
jgi:lysozyme